MTIRRCVLGVVAVAVSHALTHLPALSAQAASSPSRSTAPGQKTQASLVAPVRPVTDDYYGTKVVDPYRYMENLKDTAVLAWMKAQANYTAATLSALPGREALLARMRALSQSAPNVQATPLPGDTYLLLKREATGELANLYLRHGLTGDDRLLVDPQRITLARSIQGKGKNAIQYFAVSNDGSYVAVGIAPGGSERDIELHIFETASGHELGDVLPRAWGGAVSWLPDNHSFLYSKLQKLAAGTPATQVELKVPIYLHVLGRDSDKDPAVFGYGAVPSIRVDSTLYALVATPAGSRYALGVLNTGVSPNSAYYIESVDSVGKTNTAWRKIADSSDHVADIEVHGTDLYVLSYKDAPRYKVLRIDAEKPDLATAESIVPQSAAVVTGINPAQDGLYVLLLDGGLNRVLRVPYGPHPHIEEIALPIHGTTSVTADLRIAGALFTAMSWNQAPKIYRYDPTTKRTVDTKLQPAGPYDSAPNVDAVEVKVTSQDGTQVPLSIAYPKGMKLDGNNPTLLDGYGAYGFSRSPFYDRTLLPWYEHGGVFATCHVRGGGEYGEEWHLAGKGKTKPNTWRDFIACAQYLVDKRYTSPSHLAGQGGSAGGILIGRAITERPDLFGAALDVVGVSDALRVEITANGVPNIPEFGSTQTKEGFEALYAMSAYHHVTDGTRYPAVLLMTGFNDPRVEPWQVAKLTARLQAATSSGKPVLLRVDYAGGHGGVGGTERQHQESRADAMSFLLWQFGAPDFQPKIRP